MIALVYDVVFGYIVPFFLVESCAQIIESGGTPGKLSDGFAYLRRLRVRHLEYWHPN